MTRIRCAGLVFVGGLLVLLLALPSEAQAQEYCWACGGQENLECLLTEGWGGDKGCTVDYICPPWNPECGGGDGSSWFCYPKGEVCGPPEAIAMSGQVVVPNSWTPESAGGEVVFDETVEAFRRACDGILLAAATVGTLARVPAEASPRRIVVR